MCVAVRERDVGLDARNGVGALSDVNEVAKAVVHVPRRTTVDNERHSDGVAVESARPLALMPLAARGKESTAVSG